MGSLPLKGVDVGGHAVAIEKHDVEHEIVPIIRKQASSARKAPSHLVSDRATPDPHDGPTVIHVVVEFDPVPGTGLHADVSLRQHLEHRVDAEMQEGTRPAELKRTRQRGLSAAGGTVQEHDHEAPLANVAAFSREYHRERGTRPTSSSAERLVEPVGSNAGSGVGLRVRTALAIPDIQLASPTDTLPALEGQCQQDTQRLASRVCPQ